MAEPLRVLILEDRPADAELMVYELRRAGFEPDWQRVETEADYLAALATEPDLILADHTLPQFGAAGALERLKESGRDIPLIIVTGSISEEVAVARMKQGASDYLLKDRLARLGEAARHALHARALRVSKQQAESALRESLARLAGFARALPDLSFILDQDGKYVDVLARQNELLVTGAEHLLGRRVHDLLPPEQADLVVAAVRETIRTGATQVAEYVLDVPAGHRWFEGRTALMESASAEAPRVVMVVRDITDRKQAEQALEASERRYRLLLDNMLEGCQVIGFDWRYLYLNDAAAAQGRRTKEELSGHTMMEMFPGIDETPLFDVLRRCMAERTSRVMENEFAYPDGSQRWFSLSVQPVPEGLLIFSWDITERKQAEIHIRRLNRVYAMLSRTNHAIIHIREPQVLFDESCRIAVEEGRFLMAWVGLVEPGSDRVRVAAQAGVGDGFVENLDIVKGKKTRQPSAAAAAVRSGQPEIRNDIERDPSMKPWRTEALRIGFRSVAAFPLTVSGGVRGVMALYASEPDFFDADELRLLDEMALDVSFAMQVAEQEAERRRLEQVERELLALTQALLDISTAINSTLDLDEVLERILENAGRVIPHDGANIALYDVEAGSVELVRHCGCYARNGLPALPVGARFSLAERPAIRRMIETGQPLAIPDTQQATGWKASDPRTDWVRSYVGAPIRRGNLIIGVISLDSRTPGAFGEQDAQRLQTFADQVAIAIRNAQFFEELEVYNQLLQQAVEERTVEIVHAKERVETILNNSPDAILLLKPDGRIETGNPTFFEGFGYQPDEIFRRTPADLVAPESTASINQAIRSVMDSLETRRVEAVAQRKDGSQFEASVALAPIKEMGKLLGIVCSLLDISPMKEVERMKDAFVSNVSHELRTPITSLKLNHRLIGMNPERQTVYMDRLGREIDRLDGLIEDLLRLSRLDQGRTEMHMAAVDIGRLAAQYVDDRTPLAEDRGLALRLEAMGDLPPVEADEGLLGQAFSVLLTNALNYTPSGGTVTVRTQVRQGAEGTWAGVGVRDTGPGIEADELPSLFQRFYRGRVGHTSGMAGTGLGLAIAREIVERHRGRIEVASQGPGQGATFTVWLPAADQQVDSE